MRLKFLLCNIYHDSRGEHFVCTVDLVDNKCYGVCNRLCFVHLKLYHLIKIWVWIKKSNKFFTWKYFRDFIMLYISITPQAQCLLVSNAFWVCSMPGEPLDHPLTTASRTELYQNRATRCDTISLADDNFNLRKFKLTIGLSTFCRLGQPTRHLEPNFTHLLLYYYNY